MSRKAQDVVFARPILSQELFTEEYKAKFDSLPSWQRHLFKRVLDHGDLGQAAQEAGVSTHVNKNLDLKLGKKKTIQEALAAGGIDTDLMVSHLKECLEAETIKLDNKGNPIHVRDLKLKLATIQFIAELRGDLKNDGEGGDLPGDVEDLFEDTDVAR